MLDNGFARKLMINFLLAVAVSSDLRHGPFGKLRLYLFTAIKKALYCAVLVRLFVEAFKNGLAFPVAENYVSRSRLGIEIAWISAKLASAKKQISKQAENGN